MEIGKGLPFPHVFFPFSNSDYCSPTLTFPVFVILSVAY